MFNLPDISDGTEKTELRFWDLSSFYDPQSIYILKKVRTNEWLLKVLKYTDYTIDSTASESGMIFRDDFIASLNLERYWNLRSQSEMNNGDSFGCHDGNTILLELSDSTRYKYIMFRCPELHVTEDSSFFLVNKLSNDLRSLAKEQ